MKWVNILEICVKESRKAVLLCLYSGVLMFERCMDHRYFGQIIKHWGSGGKKGWLKKKKHSSIKIECVAISAELIKWNMK